jgi:hypothetical protein
MDLPFDFQLLGGLKCIFECFGRKGQNSLMENDPVEEGWPGRSREGRQQIPHLRSSSPPQQNPTTATVLTAHCVLGFPIFTQITLDT